MTTPDKCQMALKEWAITCEAIGRGDQILLLRKGGIHEDGKDFRVIHREFLLYPTYEHQKADLLREEHQPALEALLERPRDERQITFTHLAVADEVLELEDQGKVDDLAPHYIWTTDYAQSRLRWKPMLPLTVMLSARLPAGEAGHGAVDPGVQRLHLVGGDTGGCASGQDGTGPDRRSSSGRRWMQSRAAWVSRWQRGSSFPSPLRERAGVRVKSCTSGTMVRPWARQPDAGSVGESI